jgi:hypothetical protein
MEKTKMKLPAASCGYFERNCAEALPAFALTSYGAVASPFLSAASCRVSWRRRMKKCVLLLCILFIFLTGCITSSAEKKKDDCPSGVPASGIQK